jgi:Phage tail assembly chaperone protein, TAC
MSEVELGGIRYQVNKMNVFDQAHVARKVAPIVFGMGRGYSQALSNLGGNGALPINGEDPEPAQNTVMFDAMLPIAEILAAMTDEDVNYVLKKCLAVCQRFNGQQFVPMMRGGNLMFEDLELTTLIQLTMEVVTDNLGPSLLGLLVPASAAEDSRLQ